MNKQRLITELQSHGLRLGEAPPGAAGRRGGAGPSDHRAITIAGTTVMVPVYTDSAAQSPYTLRATATGPLSLEASGEAITPIDLPNPPQFYGLSTADGIPYWKIALLHGRDVLATTVQQTCRRYRDPATACQFCAIEKSLDAGRTIARKTPEQLAEVAAAAVRLDGVTQMIMTTGTPHTSDRGAAYLTDCAAAIRQRVNLPIQAQCEPPDDFAWFSRMRAAGIDSLGMHLESVDPAVRARIMPGKAEVPLTVYFAAFEAAVKVFGWGQVSTYLLAGLGDSLETLVEASDRLISMGVYPFVVPFVPIGETPLAHHPTPSSDFMVTLYQQVGAMLKRSGMASAAMKAGCAKCGACSALSTFEG
jgi:radical SAM protein (TIGR04043 family)